MVRMLLLHDLQQTTWLTWKLVEWKVECKLFVLECSLDHSFIALKKYSNKFYCHVKDKLFSEYEISSISLPRKCRGLARHRLHSSRQPNASNSQTNSSMFRNFKSCGLWQKAQKILYLSGLSMYRLSSKWEPFLQRRFPFSIVATMKKAFGLFVSALAAVPMAVSEESTVADGKQISAFSSKLEITVSTRKTFALFICKEI